MADGDIILPLAFEGVPPFEMGSCGAELYAALAPLAYDDDQHGWALAWLCEALGRMRQPISDLVRAWEEHGVSAYDGEGGDRVTVTMARSGWSRAAHPSRGPGRTGARGDVDLLPFIGQLVGVRGIEQLGNEDRRAAIRRRDGYSRGQRAAILSFAQRFMVGGEGEGVTLRERYDPSLGADVDAAYHGRVIVKRSRVRNLARVNLAYNPRAQVDTRHLTVTTVGSLTGVSLSRQPCAWHVGAEGCVRVAARQPPGFSGRGHLRLGIGEAGAGALPVEAGRPYTVSAYVNVLDASASTTPLNGMRWGVQWFDAGGAAVSSATGSDGPDELPLDTRLWATFEAPNGAKRAQFWLEQVTSGVAGDEIAFEATAVLVEQTDVLQEFGDADTPGWQPRGERYGSPSHGPGIDPHDLATQLLARIPAGLLYDVVITDDRDWTEVDDSWTSWDAVEAANTNWDDVLVP